MTKIENSKIVLKASAGTGKTYRLSLEYIRNLIRNIDYKDIVVMTFTKKATAEIKDRIYDFLYQIAFNEDKGIELVESLKKLYSFTEDDLDREKLRAIYFEMIKNKDEIRIYTIDGFTNRIFKTAIAPSLGVYNYETVDSEEDIFYAEILAKILDDEEYFKKFEFIIKEKGDKKNIDTYISFIKNIIYLQKDYLLSKNYENNNDDTKGNCIFIKYIEEIFQNIETVAQIKNSKNKKEEKPVTNYIKKEYEKVYLKFKNIDSQIVNDKDENRREKIEVLLENWNNFYGKDLESSCNMWDGRTVRGKEVSDIIEEMSGHKEIFLKSLSKYIYIEKIVPLHNQLKDFAENVYEIVEKMKISSKKFTHDDISTYTYKFIFNEKLKFIHNGKATEEFLDLIGGKIETIMIDEFQDTSILQWKILELLISNARNVICVGDEKQSIYSWRGGEKELFEKLDSIIDGKVENLGKSYRSYKEVIENVNRIYENYTKDWEYTPVEYRKDDDYQRGSFRYYIQKLSESENGQQNRSYEVIINMIKKGEIRNLGKSCIICRTNSHLNEIAQRLNEEGISYTLNSRASILEHGGIKPLYRLMKYFIFNNMVYLLEFMRTDLIGCLNSHVKYVLENRREIEKYINGFGDEDFHGYVTGSENKKELLEYSKINNIERNGRLFSDILLKIRKLKRLSRCLNDIYEKENFSREIVESFEVANYYQTNSDIKNIFTFFNILKGHNDLFEFIRSMEDEGENITQLSSTDVDAINLMTIHKSKGLEFDTVFYYKRDSSAGERDYNEITSYMKFDNNFNLIEKFLVVLKKYKKSLIDGYYSKLKEEIKRKDEIEEINGDYVALTRAKKNLILLFDVLEDDEGYKNKLATRLVEKYKEENYCVGEITESRKEEIIKEKEESEMIDDIMPYFYEGKALISQTGYKVNLEKEFMRKAGLAMHYYLEHIISNPLEDKRAAKSAILSRYGNILGKERLNELIVRMDRFISEKRNIYSGNYKVYTEFEIYDDEGKRKIIDRINIDEKNKKIYIYDYKTGYEPYKNEEYMKQIETYKKILEKKLENKYKIYTEILKV